MAGRHGRNPFGTRSELATAAGRAVIYRLDGLEKAGLGSLACLPFSIKVLLEAVLRNVDGFLVIEEDVSALAAWNAKSPVAREVPFKPARVILQDFTGVPAIVDLAAMRAAMQRLGGDPAKINPLVPVDLVIDHSVQVDFFGSSEALKRNADIEFERNRERARLSPSARNRGRKSVVNKKLHGLVTSGNSRSRTASAAYWSASRMSLRSRSG